MKTILLLWAIALAVAGGPAVAAAGNASPFADRKALHAHFSDPALIKQLFFQSNEIAQWLAGECKRGEAACHAALEIMNRPFTRWNQLDGKNGFHVIASCRRKTAIAHPNPALHRILGVPLVDSLRDINGKLWLLFLCDGIEASPGGFWTSQLSSWCRSITGLNDIWIISYMNPVPGTDYQVLSHLPYDPKSFREIEETVRKLNSQVDEWAAEWAEAKN